MSNLGLTVSSFFSQYGGLVMAVLGASLSAVLWGDGPARGGGVGGGRKPCFWGGVLPPQKQLGV